MGADGSGTGKEEGGLALWMHEKYPMLVALASRSRTRRLLGPDEQPGDLVHEFLCSLGPTLCRRGYADGQICRALQRFARYQARARRRAAGGKRVLSFSALEKEEAEAVAARDPPPGKEGAHRGRAQHERLALLASVGCERVGHVPHWFRCEGRRDDGRPSQPG